MNVAILVGVTIVAVLILVKFLKWRAGAGFTLDDFAKVVQDAANAGEVAYRAQLDEIGRRQGREFRPSKRGLAMARLLCALFPTAAYVVTDANNGLPKSIKKGQPPLGKHMWNFASGAALLPLGLASEHPDRNLIAEDSTRATAKFVDYFGNMFRWDPAADLALASVHLGPLWDEAIQCSIEGADAQAYRLQFCTSGLRLYADWMEAFKDLKEK